MENPIIVTTPQQIQSIIMEALELYDSKKQSKESNYKLLTINQVRTVLHVGYSTVSKLIERGLLKKTADGKILQSELDRYLSNK